MVGVEGRQGGLPAVLGGLVVNGGAGEVAVVGGPLGHGQHVPLLDHAPGRDSEEGYVAAEALAGLACRRRRNGAPSSCVPAKNRGGWME